MDRRETSFQPNAKPVPVTLTYIRIGSTSWDANGNGPFLDGETSTCGDIGSGTVYYGNWGPGYFAVENEEVNIQLSYVGFEYQNQEQYQAQSRYVLKTGGQAVRGQQNLWILNASATTDFPYIRREFSVFPPVTAIPLSQITLAGQTLDVSGNVPMSLPNNASIDLMVTTPSNSYVYNISPTEYQPLIQANGIALDPVNINATFCVGQQIQFSLAFSPALRYSNEVCTWTIPAKFVNSWSANLPGSTVYTNNSTYLVTTNGPCTCWYVNGSGGTVSVSANMILANGKTVPVAAVGQFAIERPNIYMLPTDIDEPRYFTLTSNIFGGATVKLGSPGTGQNVAGQMVYGVRCETDVGGLGMITQTCQLSYNPDSGGFNFSDWRLDGSTNYDGPTNIPATTTYVFFPTFDDGPNNSTSFSTSSIEVKGKFTDYIMFQPTNTPGSIYVTLGIVTWNVDGLITNAPTGWTFITTNTPDPVGPNNSDQFPFYTQPQQ